jgi:GT2 family glycosyltransferase/glycosyltransferase involved in cell wall biosynthesis
VERSAFATDLKGSSSEVRVLFGSGSPELIEATIACLPKSLPLVVVSEFKPSAAEWIPYHIHRTLEENRDLVVSKLGARIIHSGVILFDRSVPHRGLRELGHSMLREPTFFDESGETTEKRYASKEKRRRLLAAAATTLRLLNPQELRLSILYRRALRRKHDLVNAQKPLVALEARAKPPGISVVIPSRNGRELLERCLPGIAHADEIIVIDNGSDDGTVEWLRGAYPSVIVDYSWQPLAFSVAMNRGIRKARFAYVCALNNDMLVEPGFLRALRAAFECVPDLFCSSAQIFLPPGQRREETGKTVFNLNPAVTDLPLRCDEPLEGEDLTWVPYGSGGCSLYDAAKLETLGGFDEAYTPAYVEDLDLGIRAWSLGWPSVYCAGARVHHEHRATTSRYFSTSELDLALESNYLRFLVRGVAEPERFLRLWDHAVLRLKALQKASALSVAARMTPARSAVNVPFELFDGSIAVFPGRRPTGKPIVLVVSPYLPFPLSHGAAVRIYNLVREAVRDFDVVLIAFLEEARTVPRELLDLCAEVVTVLRRGSHALPSRGRPDTVEEYDSPAFQAALRQTIVKWKPGLVQLEFTQMAVYAAHCAGLRTILVEHDITYDLYAQMLARPETNDWETRRQHELWRGFEIEAWKQVDRVVTMSEKDRVVVGARAVAIGNGVDLERFRPSAEPPEPRRLLFIGSFAHRPNVLALEFFLREVFPHLRAVTLHVIAGQNHTRFWDLQHAGVEVEGFVSDVRPAYRRSAIVIAPLVASAGTNVKIVEAMAMGKAIVSTDAGIHGLEVRPGRDVVVANDARDMGAAIDRLLRLPEERIALEREARATAEKDYGWPAMARVQKGLYETLLKLSGEHRIIEAAKQSFADPGRKFR